MRKAKPPVISSSNPRLSKRTWPLPVQRCDASHRSQDACHFKSPRSHIAQKFEETGVSLHYLFLLFLFRNDADLDLFKWKTVYETVGEAGYKTEGRLILIYFIQPEIPTFPRPVGMRMAEETFCLLSFALSLRSPVCV